MIEYIVKQGDTFALISRKNYGTENDVTLIINANPGVQEPLTAGISIVIPNNPNLPDIIPNDIPANSINEVALKIKNDRFRFWESIKITRSVDTFDTIEFTAPLELDNQAFRDIFTPLSYNDISLTVGGKPLFKGVIITPIPSMVPNKKSVSVSGYSLPGVLNDCNLPASAFPLEFNNQGLEDIAKTVARFFGLLTEFKEQQGPVFEKVAATPEKRGFDFLTGLAQQRNFVISSTPDGKLLFQRSIKGGKPVARFVQGQPPIISVVPSFKAQEYFSHITGLSSASMGEGGSSHTVKNPRLSGIIRPHTFKAKDTENGNIKTATEAKAARMFANVVSYSMSIATWRDAQGNLWEPNTTITLIAPGVMIYSEYEFLIRSVELTKEADTETAVLNLVIPESFNGTMPERLPWEL